MKQLLLTLWLRLVRPVACRPDTRRRLRSHYARSGAVAWWVVWSRRGPGPDGYTCAYVLAYVAAGASKVDEVRMQLLVDEARALTAARPHPGEL